MTTDGVAPSKAPPGWLRRHGWKLVASLVLAAAFAYLLNAGALPILPDRAALAKVSGWSIAAYVLIYCFVHVLRAARWYLLLAALARVPLRKVIAVAFIGFFAIVALPFRTGEMVRPVLIRKKGVLSGWAAMGTVAAERVMDGLALSLVLFIALITSKPLDPLPERIGNLPVSAAVVPAAAYLALTGFFVAFVVMGAFYVSRAWARRTTERIFGIVSHKLARSIADRVEQLASGLGFLPRASHTVPFAAATAVYWLTNAAGLLLLARSSGFDTMSYAEACVVMGVLALGILTPNAPGFFGAYQLAVYAGLAMFFPQEQVMGTGGAFVFLLYVAQLAVNLFFAVLGMAIEHTGLSDALEADAD